MAKAEQTDLEQYIKDKSPQKTVTHDLYTGEVFQPKSRNHYEENDGVPFAPPVDLPRPTLRQRVENLLNRGGDPLARYIADNTTDDDFDVPDDPDAPLTASEQNYVDIAASVIADELGPQDGDPPPAGPPQATQQPPKAAAASQSNPSSDPKTDPVPT